MTLEQTQIQDWARDEQAEWDKIWSSKGLVDIHRCGQCKYVTASMKRLHFHVLTSHRMPKQPKKTTMSNEPRAKVQCMACGLIYMANSQELLSHQVACGGRRS